MNIKIEGSHHEIQIDKADKLAVKMAMLIEATLIGVQAAIKKYGYTEQRYYQLLKIFKEKGSQGLIEQNRGPKSNRVRKQAIVNQIIRYRFLDPSASAGVIAQKMAQAGYSLSTRSVERTITEYGLQKKTLPVRERK